MTREIYATDGTYHLVKLTEEDKERFLELMKQDNENADLWEKDSFRTMMWNFAVEESENLNYSIYDENDEYCGNIVLQNPKDKLPEIGVDIVVKKRNQGIAAKAIKMLAKRAYEDRQVDYYLLKVSSFNSHSKHMIEKLGATLIGTEETIYARAIRKLQEMNLDKDNPDMNATLSKMREEIEDKQEVVYRYKLGPDRFL